MKINNKRAFTFYFRDKMVSSQIVVFFLYRNNIAQSIGSYTYLHGNIVGLSLKVSDVTN